MDHREIRIDPVLGYFYSLFLEPFGLQMLLHLEEPCYLDAEKAVVDLVVGSKLCDWDILLSVDGLWEIVRFVIGRIQDVVPVEALSAIRKMKAEKWSLDSAADVLHLGSVKLERC